MTEGKVLEGQVRQQVVVYDMVRIFNIFLCERESH